MKSSSVLIVGCGDLGGRLSIDLLKRDWQVTGVRRDTTKLPAGIMALSADYTQPGSLAAAEAMQPDFVVAIFNPFDRSVEGYRAGFFDGMQNLLVGLGSHRPKHIFMTSSTRVFAQNEGGWVDESSPLTEEDLWAAAIIDAERLLLDSVHPASVIRLAGVYGIPGGRLLARISRGEICPEAPVSFTNRIHREDCAGFLLHLIDSAEQGEPLDPIYIGVDDLPAPRYEVESWLAKKLGVARHHSEPTGVSSEPTRHNTAGNKRCRNTGMKRSGYQLIHSDYKSGYTALLRGS